MKLTISHKDKSWLSFDLKDLMWLILVVGVWATVDYRGDEQLKHKMSQQKHQLANNNTVVQDIIDISLTFALKERMFLDQLTTDLTRDNPNSMSLQSVGSMNTRLNTYLRALGYQRSQLEK